MFRKIKNVFFRDFNFNKLHRKNAFHKKDVGKFTVLLLGLLVSCFMVKWFSRETNKADVRVSEATREEKKKQKKSKVSAVTMQTPSVALRFHCTLHKTLRPKHADKCSSYGAQIRSTSGCRRTTCFLFTELDAADTAGKHDD